MVLGAGHYWIQVNEEGEPTGKFCSAWYGESDKPVDGKWILLKTVENASALEVPTKEGHRQCGDCGMFKDDVEDTTCPYNEEINRVIEEITVCGACYKQRLYDI